MATNTTMMLLTMPSSLPAHTVNVPDNFAHVNILKSEQLLIHSKGHE